MASARNRSLSINMVMNSAIRGSNFLQVSVNKLHTTAKKMERIEFMKTTNFSLLKRNITSLENHLGKIRSTSAKISANPIKLDVTASRDALTTARKDMTALERSAKQTAFYTKKTSENLTKGAVSQKKISDSMSTSVSRSAVASTVVAPVSQSPVVDHRRDRRHLSGTAMAGALTAGGVMVVPFNASINFETAMADVKAFTKDMNAQNFDILSSKARELGATTEWSATQAAQGMKFLAIAGFNTKQQLGAMNGVLGLATAGSVDLATSANIASNILSGFQIKAEKMGMVSDVLAKTFTTSNTDLMMLGETMKYVAPVASGLNVGIAEVSALAGKLGNVGIQASMAGTSLRQIYSRLSAPPKQAQEALESLNVSAYNAKGNFKGLPTIIGELNTAMKGLSEGDKNEKMKHIFGMTALSSGIALLKEGKESILKYKSTIDNSLGTTKKIQEIKLDTTLGQFKLLSSAVEGLNISLTLGLLPVIRYVTGGLTSVTSSLNAFTDKFPELSKWVFGLGAGLIVGTVALAGFGLVVTGVGSALTFLAGPVTAITLGVIALGTAGVALYTKFKPVRDTLNGLWDGFKEGIAPATVYLRVMVSNISSSFSNLYAYVSPVFSKIGTLLDGIGISSTSIGNAIGRTFSLMAKNAYILYGGIKSVFTSVSSVLKDVFAGFSESIAPFLLGFKESLGELWSGMQSFYQAIKPVLSNIGGVFSFIFGSIKPLFVGIGEALTSVGVNATSVGSAIGTVFKIVLYPVELFVSALGSVLTAGASLITGFSSIGKSISAVWSRNVARIKAPFVSLFNWIEEKFKSIMGVVDKVRNIGSGITNKISGVGSSIKESVSAKASSLFAETKSFLGFDEEKKKVSTLKSPLLDVKEKLKPINNTQFVPEIENKLLYVPSVSSVTEQQIKSTKEEMSQISNSSNESNSTTNHYTYQINAQGANAEEVLQLIQQHQREQEMLDRDLNLKDVS